MNHLPIPPELNTEAPPPHYLALKGHVERFIDGYHNDLLKHDLNSLCMYPELPFLHFTRNHGTNIVFMPPADHPSWPVKGVKVPYLFGEADRDHILKEILGAVRYHCDKSIVRAIYQFTGNPKDQHGYIRSDLNKLHEISRGDAMSIAEAYYNRIRHAWEKEDRK